MQIIVYVNIKHYSTGSLPITAIHSESYLLHRDVIRTIVVCSLSDNTGLLLLCEVAAKPFFEQHHANYNADADCKAAKKMYACFPLFTSYVHYD